jgi:hypothetical protein
LQRSFAAGTTLLLVVPDSCTLLACTRCGGGGRGGGQGSMVRTATSAKTRERLQGHAAGYVQQWSDAAAHSPPTLHECRCRIYPPSRFNCLLTPHGNCVPNKKNFAASRIWSAVKVRIRIISYDFGHIACVNTGAQDTQDGGTTRSGKRTLQVRVGG